jgi:hypothetical protein
VPSIAEPSLQVPTPTYTLFNDSAVGLATILGTPVAGSALMALNYRRMGQTRKAAEVLVVGIAVTGLLILLGWNLPHSVTSPIALLALFVMARSARSLQGKTVMEHIQQGGRLGSKWMAFGLGAGIAVASSFQGLNVSAKQRGISLPESWIYRFERQTRARTFRGPSIENYQIRMGMMM